MVWLIHLCFDAMVGRVPYTALQSAIYAHPTMAEGLTFLLRGTPVPA